jgi:hypothetical protein
LGKSAQGTANKYINKTNVNKVANTIGTGFKEHFYDPKKMAAAGDFKGKLSAINKGSIIFTSAFPAITAIGYTANKAAIKDQAKQSEEAIQRTYAAPAPVLGNLGRQLRVGFKRGFKKDAMKQGVIEFGQGVNKTARNIKLGTTAWAKNPVRNTLSGVSSFLGGGGKKGTNRFINEMKQQAKISGNEGTAKVADFLGRHKTLAVGGSIAAGAMMFKPLEWGDKAVKTTVGSIDKNAMRYEKSQNKQVGEE